MNGVMVSGSALPGGESPIAFLGLTVRAAMLGPDSLPLAGSLLETPHPTPKNEKGTVVNLYLWVPRTVEQMSDLITAYLP
jgi:hypothetical protein